MSYRNEIIFRAARYLIKKMGENRYAGSDLVAIQIFPFLSVTIFKIIDGTSQNFRHVLHKVQRYLVSLVKIN